MKWHVLVRPEYDCYVIDTYEGRRWRETNLFIRADDLLKFLRKYIKSTEQQAKNMQRNLNRKKRRS